MQNSKYLFPNVEDEKWKDEIYPQSLQTLRFVSRRQHCLWIGIYFSWEPQPPTLWQMPSGHLASPTHHTHTHPKKEFPQGIRVDKRGILCCQKDEMEFQTTSETTQSSLGAEHFGFGASSKMALLTASHWALESWGNETSASHFS